MLSVGEKFPAFELSDSDMNMVSANDCEGKNYIVYFYPKDDTPGCTIEGLEFTDLSDEFNAANTAIIGVSKDTCVSHAAFRDKFGLTVRLLADVEGVLCDACGVWQEKEKNGVTKMGIVRSTFLVDSTGIIRHAEYGVVPKGHAEAMLSLAKAL